ncbi:MBL fold metallo-hydrolase [Epidermidibacterium keratini]|uniref:MBL fold metallo-hydrolase n=1 Tax=Epidermidibacterium keratini TaxID=1891644 RepID=A0A7L4YPH1_9ACTN|nr:MBL fold metallo-hydrolase [Epidermidibacterium keratini]QHC00922.1 MBL fold metallo-hydrolase [Epidermidibacterium keratini]
MSEFVEVAPGVLVATHDYSTTTTVVLDGSDGALVIDPAISVTQIDAMAATLRGWGRAIRAGFATHWHWDHVLWRPALGDAPRYASAATITLAQRHAAANAAEAAESGLEVDVAWCTDLVTLQTDEIPWDGPAAVVTVHDGHAAGHSAVFLPGSGVLVAGDMLSDIEVPILDLDTESPVDDYAHGLELFADLADQVQVVVPGHGGIGDGPALRRRISADLRYLDDLTAGRPSADPRLAGAPEWLRTHHHNTATMLQGLASDS